MDQIWTTPDLADRNNRMRPIANTVTAAAPRANIVAVAACAGKGTRSYQQRTDIPMEQSSPKQATDETRPDFGKPISAFFEGLEELVSFVDTLDAVLEKEGYDTSGDVWTRFVKGEAKKAGFEGEAALVFEDQSGDDVSTTPSDERAQAFSKIAKAVFSPDRASGSFKQFLEELQTAIRRSHHRGRLFESSLITLLSINEIFVGALLRAYADVNKAFVDKKRQFSLEDLRRYVDLESVEAIALEMQVTDVLFLPIEQQADYLCQISLKDSRQKCIEPYLQRIVEIDARRNVIVHGGGIIGPLYNRRLEKVGLEPGKIGDKLIIDRDYLDQAIAVFRSSFGLLGFAAWKKLAPRDERRGGVALSISYFELEAGRLENARKISELVIDDDKLIAKHREGCRVNHWLSFREDGKFPKIEDEIRRWDVSAQAGMFKLAKRLLLDEYQGIEELIAHEIRTDATELNLMYVDSWPLFENYRKLEDFGERRKRIEASL
jgi:hypothetical protein